VSALRAWLAIAAASAGCASGGSAGCKDLLLPGELVITEVFANFAAPGGGTDTAKEWFEIYNATDRPLEVKGLTLRHSRPDGTSAKAHTMTDVVIAPGQFFTLGNAAPDRIPAYVDYGYGGDLGDFFNTDGGKLALACGDREIDSASYTAVKAGHSRELSAAQPPDSTVNDDPANWCQGNDTEFESGNFGTPGQDNDCIPLAMGQCNASGTMRDIMVAGSGDLVITEIMPSPAKVADAVGEWFEAVATQDVDLNGVGLDRAADAAMPNVITSTDCLHVTAGTYVVFAKATDPSTNGGLPIGQVVGTFTFSLVGGTTASPGDVRLVAGATVIDSVTWTSSRNGKALALDPDLIDPIANDSPSNFCDATTAYGLGDLGTPGAVNGQCATLPPPGMCTDPITSTVRAIVKPAAGQLVISEIMPNPKVEPGEEWFEITNTGAAAFDLNELGLDRAGDTRTPDLIHAADCKRVAPGGFALFARSADPASNGMLPAVDATFGLSMPNTGGDVRVLDGATVLDAVTWTTSTDGVSSQVQPAHLTTTDNDTAANFCPGIAGYGDLANKGTPKAANACM
jgi:hypothetical protein